jgi:hypothetical protein
MDECYRIRFVSDGLIRSTDFLCCDLEMIRTWVYRELYRLTDLEPELLWTATITEGLADHTDVPEGDRPFVEKVGGLSEGLLIAFAALLDDESIVRSLFAVPNG